jgi:uncharacterized iron-regulated membrane protein
MLRKVAFKLHSVAGLAIGVFVLVVSLTGSVLVFKPEIDRALLPELMVVERGALRVPLDVAVEQARKVAPGAVSLIRMPQIDTDPYIVWPADPALPNVYVDPYTGSVLGTLHHDEGLTGFLLHLHTELLAGERGLIVVGILGLLLVLLCLTGIVVWWPARGKLRMVLTVAWWRNWQRVTFDLHRAGGFWTLVFVLVTSVTGAALVFYEAAGVVVNWITASQLEQPVPPPSVPLSGAAPVPLEAALQAAAAELPELKPVYIYPPLEEEAPIGIRGRLPGELHPNGRSFVYVDQYSGAPVQVWNALQAGRGDRIRNTLYPIHIGRFGGTAMRILYVILGLAPAALAVTGTIMWINRHRQKKRGRKRSSPPLQTKNRSVRMTPEMAEA